MDLKIALIGKNDLLLSLRNMNVTIFQTSDISLKNPWHRNLRSLT